MHDSMTPPVQCLNVNTRRWGATKHLTKAFQRKPARSIRPLGLQLVADLSQKVFTPRDALGILDPLALAAVDDAENAAALIGFGDNDFDGICRGAEDAADLGHHLDGIEHVHREKTGREEQDEAVAGGQA
jgi:hypothetical protein